jgi:hypothetical protein
MSEALPAVPTLQAAAVEGRSYGAAFSFARQRPARLLRRIDGRGPW